MALIKIWSIAWKDLRSTMRNVPALVMMLVAPLALAGLLGLAFGGGQSFSISAIKVAVANQDQPVAGGQNLGATVANVLTSRDLKDVLNATTVGDAGAARARVDDGKAAVAVVVPPGFSAAVYGNQGRQAAVELYENPTDTLGSSITSAVVDHTLIDLNGARAAAVAAAAVAGGGAGHDAAARAAAATFIANGGVSRALAIAQRSPTAKGHQTSTVGLVLAGMMVFFTLFGASNVARTILTEDRGGTLPRLLTTPTSPSVILGGKFGSVFLTVTVQITVLLVAGLLIFGIHWGGPVSVVVLTVVGAAVASSLALLIISVVKTPGQAGAIGAGIYLVLALAGGNFTGTATSAGAYATVQRFTPNGWLLHGWDAAMRDTSFMHVLAQLLVPLAFTVVFFTIAALRFRRRYA